MRRHWAVYLVVLVTLALIVFVFLRMTWPQPWDLFVEQVLLREAMPEPWAPPPPAASLAGCYRLAFRDCVLGSEARQCLGSFPREIELTLEPREYQGHEVFVVRAAGEPLSSWSVTPEGILSVGLGNGFSGIVLRLGRGGVGLRGVASTWTDTLSTSQWASVVATRQPCASTGNDVPSR